ncbi:BT1926 family outer membrane beta-barrel protein [Lutibacter citreus]|uniref:BT1926 family outer membrane beta-barrel protein n=1 Tax=Lutibacter citreus TaxID=2138210 RepID=UPI000DBE4DE0|nr:BT1926 family outer membrane beta-barrel protein [Lutibacter citreus]
MKNKIIFSFLLSIFTVVGMNAQDKDSQSKDACAQDTCEHSPRFAPKRGDFTAQMLFGRGNFANYNLTGQVPTSSTSSAYAGTGSTVMSTDLVVSEVSANDNSISNMTGAEFRYYVSDKVALKVSGAAILRNTPYQVNIPGVNDPTTGAVIIPGYSTVDSTEEIQAQFSIGAEYLLKTNNERLFPYVGINLPFDYARSSVFTPASIDISGNVSIPDTGARHYEVTAYSAQFIAGADYYIAKGLFAGFEIKPASYTYATSVKSPAPELRNLEVENSTVSFFAQYSFKLGFKF